MGLYEVKTDTIKFATEKKKAQINQLAVLERKLKQIQNRLASPEHFNLNLFTEQDKISQLEDIKREIDELLEIQVRGAMVRSRANWFQFGENHQNTSLN